MRAERCSAVIRPCLDGAAGKDAKAVEATAWSLVRDRITVQTAQLMRLQQIHLLSVTGDDNAFKRVDDCALGCGEDERVRRCSRNSGCRERPMQIRRRDAALLKTRRGVAPQDRRRPEQVPVGCHRGC